MIPREYEAAGPMVRHELRLLMRRRAAQVLFAGTAAAIITTGVFLYAAPELRGGCTPEAMARAGRSLFRWLAGLEGVLVLVLAPLLTAESIAGERRRGTLDSLLLTRLTARDIVRGKLLALLGVLALAFGALLPVYAVTSLLGGVSPWEIVLVHLLLLGAAAGAGAFGLFCSARLHGRLPVAAAAVAGALAMVTPLQWGIYARCLAAAPRRAPRSLPTRGCAWPLLLTIFGGYLLGVLLLAAVEVPFFALCAVSPFGALTLLLFDGLPYAGAWWFAGLIALLLLRVITRRLIDTAARALVRPDPPPTPAALPPPPPAVATPPPRRW